MQTSSPLFKGATRPACIAGVPIKPFILNLAIWILLAVYVWIPLMLLCPITHYVLSRFAEKDDQIFNQLFSYFRLNILGHKNRLFWNGISSFSPRQQKELFVFENREKNV